MISLRHLSIGLIFFVLYACEQDSHGNNGRHNPDLTPPENALFKMLPSSETGIDFKNTLQEDWNINYILYPYLYNSGGVGVIDINNDGLQDLFFTSTLGSCKLYLNKGGFHFEEIAAKAGVEAKDGIKTGIAVADINGDGWQDIYLCRTGFGNGIPMRKLLFINNKDNTFSEKAHEYGLDADGPTTSATFFDYDLDGDLDVFLANHPADFASVNNVDIKPNADGTISRNTSRKDTPESNRLLRNDKSVFHDVTAGAGLLDIGFSLSALATDVNEDGYPDLIVGNDYVEPDAIYINNKNGTFSDRESSTIRHMSSNSMGSDAADINNDGLTDFFVLDMLAEDYKLQKARVSNARPERYFPLVQYGYGYQEIRNMMQLNNGNGTYSEIGCLAGVFQTDWSWGCLFDDFDHDGFQDLYVTNGFYRDVNNADYINFTSDSINRLYPEGIGPQNMPDINGFLALIPQFRLLNYAFRNKGDLTFEDASVKWGLGAKSYSNGLAYADLDNDGDMDLIVNNIDEEAFVYKNTAIESQKGNWLQIKLQGNPGNSSAIGAKARITAGGQIFYKELQPSRGFMSSVEPIFHFGLGTVSKIDRLEVQFPEGKLLVQENVPVNQRLTLSIAQAKPGKLSPLPSPKPFVTEVTAPAFKHTEDPFLDFNREALIPWRMSIPGPHLATADVNGDGLEDVFIGGATKQAGALFLQKPGGAFTPASAATWETDKDFEDVGCVFADIDLDGDQDLVVASGGNTAAANSTAYQSRIYKNDGKGNFTRSGGLPGLRDPVGAISVRDYDSDGAPDLFLGGWCVPGSYPIAAPGSVLKNDGKGNFSDVTATVAPDFAKAGIVYDLQWGDLNGDKQPELIVAAEWMPIRIFEYKNGKFQETTDNYGLNNLKGLWRSVLAADFDGDGDVDLVGGNFGLNSRYRASDAEPLRMYAKDFDKNGSMDGIMTEMQYGQELTLAYRDILVKQIPSVKKKFLRYTDYANATVTDIFAPSDLKEAQIFSCNELRSMYFENQGGKFTATPLSSEAQAFPVYAQLAIDLNQDGRLDWMGAGNDRGQQVETGSIDAGNGLILLGGPSSKGTKPVYARNSGFWANRQARRMVSLKSADGSVRVIVSNNNGPVQCFLVKGK